MKIRIFYGWWMTIACLVALLVGNALGLFGAGVYLHAAISSGHWSTGIVSGAITSFYIVSAVLLIPVGDGIVRYGPRLFIAIGAVALACGVVGVGRVSEPWQAYLVFPVMGVGWACLSTTAVATTLAPWFEEYQARAVSVASIGASVGGMIGPPLLLAGIARMGFASTTSLAGGIAIAILLPLAIFVFRRRPEDLGLLPDGASARPQPVSGCQPSGWDRRAAVRTPALRTIIVAFGFGMSMQIGFLTHQVTLLSQSLDNAAVAAIVSITAASALAGRLVLVKCADQVDARVMSSVVFTVAALSFGAVIMAHGEVALTCASAVFGLTVGNVTTLSPILVRREFGAAAFGKVFGVASCAIQVMAALGPGLFGFLYDVSGSYHGPLLAAAGFDILAAGVILIGRKSSGDHATRADPDLVASPDRVKMLA